MATTKPIKIEGPTDQTIELGNQATLEVSVTGGTVPYKYQWSEKNTEKETTGEEIGSPDGNKQAYAPPTAKEAVTKWYRVKVTDSTKPKAKTKSSRWAKLEVTTPPDREPVFIWSDSFASNAGLVVSFAFVLMLIPMWVVAYSVLRTENVGTHFQGAIAVQLLIVGAFLAAVAAFMSLIELRGRGVRLDQLDKLGSSAWEAIPKAMSEFAKLKTTAAVGILAIACLVMATMVTWKSLDAASTTTTTTVAPVSTTVPTDDPTTTLPPETP
ncbi:MAG: SprB repeat-containing protein [Acidimicrobiia bacterium]